MVLEVRCRVVGVLATMELASALPLATTARRVDAVSVRKGDHRGLPSMLSSPGIARCHAESATPCTLRRLSLETSLLAGELNSAAGECLCHVRMAPTVMPTIMKIHRPPQSAAAMQHTGR